jgi:cytoskeletal protein RodZ
VAVVSPDLGLPPPLPGIDSSTVFTGALLKQLRESRGLTLKQISAQTRIIVASLQAVEAERFDDLPDARIYVRGFVRCLAIELALNPDQVAQSYLKRWDAWYEEHTGKRTQKPRK